MRDFAEANLNLSDVMPDPFRVEVWQAETRKANRTAVDCIAMKNLFEGFNPPPGSGRVPLFEVGPIYAEADAIVGAGAPGLPLSLLVDNGNSMTLLNYQMGVKFKHAFGTNVVFQGVGEMMDIIDGNVGGAKVAQDSYVVRLQRLLAMLVPGLQLSAADLIMSIDGVEMAADAYAKRVLLPFDINRPQDPSIRRPV